MCPLFAVRFDGCILALAVAVAVALALALALVHVQCTGISHWIGIAILVDVFIEAGVSCVPTYPSRKPNKGLQENTSRQPEAPPQSIEGTFRKSRHQIGNQKIKFQIN